jgi:predicted membrane protein
MKPSHHNESGETKRRVLAGLLIVFAGAAWLFYQLDLLFLPKWIFSWPIVLILVGLFIGFRHSFRNPGWFVLVAIGTFFLIEQNIPDIHLKNYFWPVLLIIIGIYIMLKPKRNTYKGDEDAWMGNRHDTYTQSHEGYIESVSVFGGVKRNIITNDFKGGEIVSIFGGTECNLSQANLVGKATLEATQIFGGTKLIIPADWELKSEAVAIFGGVKDNRVTSPSKEATQKVLILKGTCLFGGIQIYSA